MELRHPRYRLYREQEEGVGVALMNSLLVCNDDVKNDDRDYIRLLPLVNIVKNIRAALLKDLPAYFRGPTASNESSRYRLFAGSVLECRNVFTQPLPLSSLF